MKILLLRHGATAGNQKKSYIGKTDEPLSPLGIWQAQAAGTMAGLPFVCVSPLLRARQTAGLMFPEAEQIVLEDLREMDFGIFEGRNAEEMKEDGAYRSWVESGCLAPCPGGESRQEFSRRVQRCFGEVVCSHLAQGTDCLVFVVHGGVIMAVLERFSRPAMDYYDGYADNCQGFLGTAVSAPGEEPSFFLTDLQKIFTLKESGQT